MTLAVVVPQVPEWYDNTVVELGGAILATHVLIALNLRRRGAPAPDEDIEVIAGQAWADVAPLWLQAATPIIKETYVGIADELTDDELDELAGTYAESLGGYLSESNAEALADGFDRGLAAGWHERVAWQRVTAAYGLDKPGMRTFMRQVMAQGGDDIVATAVSTLIDRLAAERATRIAENEVWNASQSGLALAWLTLQERGALPATMGREWVTDPNEVPCSICGVMAGQWVPLGELFTLPDGSRTWAPGAHPNCRCGMELVDQGEGIAKDKGDDLYDRDTKGRFADREYRTRDITTTYAEADLPEVAAIMEELKQVKDPFGVARPDLFGQRTADLFGAPDGGAFGKPDVDAFGVRRATAAEQAILDAAFDLDHAVKTAAGKSTRVVHHFFAGTGTKREGPKPQSKHEPHYLGVDDLGQYLSEYWGTDEVHAASGNVIDFDEINDFYADQASMWEPEDTPTPVTAYPGGSAWTHIYEQIDVGRDDWHETVRQALPIWHEAQNNARVITQRLEPYELNEIMKRAGFDDRYNDGPDDVRTKIVANIHDSHTPDRSLSEAYADYITWGRPDLVGEDGKNFSRHLAVRLNDGEDYELGAIAPRQVFVFDQGFHDDSTSLKAQYRVTHIQYRSALADYGEDAPVGKMSMQELYLDPIGSVRDHDGYVSGEDDDLRSGPLY